MKLIGILEMAAPDGDRLAYWQVFVDALGACGLVKNRDYALCLCWANGSKDRLARAAQELIADSVDVIVTAGTPAAAAAMQATSDIPIVMATGVSLGTNLSNPDAPASCNATGISDLPRGISKLRLSLLREALVPDARLAFLADRANPSSPLAVQETLAAASELGIDVVIYWLEDWPQIASVLGAMRADGVGGFVVAPGAMFFARRHELASHALDHGLATVAVRREYAEAGCLMAYGAPLRENYSEAARLVSRILAGEKPSDIPITEPTTFELVMNLDSAQALRIDMPASLLARAETFPRS
ncbi:MAG: transporter substrate-binding protein [Hyphomicrobiales bacterium]|nr:transporter substrate-binding protein [Hyphomicrobiales bacterium]